MKLSELSLKKPVTTIMITLLVVLLGFVSLRQINLDLFPDITYPGAAVITEYSETGPEEMENMVTRPMESSISTVSNINNLSSVSEKGSSQIVAEFDWGTDMDTATMDMRESIDLVRDVLPDEAGDPMIVKFDPSMLPIMQLGVTDDRELDELTKYIEDQVSPRLERLEGVASVDVVGEKEREILASINRSEIENYGISLTQITNQLMSENLNISGGDTGRGSQEYLVRLTGKFDSVAEIRETRIPTAEGGTVPLGEIAEVKDTYKEMQNISRLNSKDSLSLLIQKQTDANTVSVSRRVKEEIAAIEEEELATNMVMVPIMDQAEYIQESIGNVSRNAIFGAILAVIVLLIFLRNIRSTLIITAAIPVSIITAFLLLYFNDLTLNMMTLGGLALGIGMLVDNSIVVLENIYRYNSRGLSGPEAALKGSTEVGTAITASTLTTAIVFLPVVFVEGIASQLFSEFSLTVAFSLFASLIVALTVIPVISSRLMIRGGSTGVEKNKHHLLEKIKNVYRGSLSWCLSHRKMVIVSALIVFGLSLALFPFIGSEFIPESDTGEISVTASLPMGTNISRTDEVAREIEEFVGELPEVENVLTNVGSSGQMDFSGGSTETLSLSVQLVDPGQRSRSTEEVITEIEQGLKIPDVDLTVSSQDAVMMGTGSPVTVRVKGNDLGKLEDTARNIRNELESLDGLRNIDDSISEGRPEFQVNVNRAVASRYGFTMQEIGSGLETAVGGRTASRYEEAGEEYDITVKMDDDYVSGPEDIKNIKFPARSGGNIALGDFASFNQAEGPRQILRENQVRYAEITADTHGVDLGTAQENVQERIDERVTIPEGYELEYTGEYEEMISSFESLFYAFLLSIVLVYMVMASQFESLLHPFVIMFTVPMAIIGVLVGLFITGNALSVVSIIGVIMLAGVVVNNGIVFVDYINIL
ncbi:MAG: efflux RND transporter permease subunit, partial [Halanaerobiales bacterium]